MKLKLFIFIILIFIFSKTQAYAFENSSRSSAVLAQADLKNINDERVNKLKAYLEANNSPMTAEARVFVEAADQYDLDWRLVAAISGLESGFGNHIPANSYNAWGWGVYGDNVIRFSSWEDGIRTISQGLRERYMNERGARNVYQIGSTYAASPTWAQRVLMYMDRIDSYATLDPLNGLSISL
ncbi:MAG: glucosaminidase domain-containing protein [Patescibacteria group bacterium]